MPHILIVEDDPNIAKMIGAALSISNYTYEHCDDGSDAVVRICDRQFDLILLDIMLPGMDGFNVIAQVRHREIPVIFLSALQDVADKVKGLHLGAEDYIVKPFEAVELLARIEVVLRRFQKTQTQLVYGAIEVDLSQHRVRKEGKEIPLTPKEFDVLTFFLQNIDVAITRERLLASVWGYGFEGETRTVDIHVQQIRRKLDLQNTLVTLPKLGYRLNSEGDPA